MNVFLFALFVLVPVLFTVLCFLKGHAVFGVFGCLLMLSLLVLLLWLNSQPPEMGDIFIFYGPLFLLGLLVLMVGAVMKPSPGSWWLKRAARAAEGQSLNGTNESR
jgi:hypothetical protein